VALFVEVTQPSELGPRRRGHCRHSSQSCGQSRRRIRNRGRRGCEGVHFQKRQHLSQYRRQLSEPDVHRLDPGGIAGLEVSPTVGHRREARQDHRPHRDVQRKAQNSDQCRLSARGRVSASSHARPNTDRDLDLIAQHARSINKAETTPGRNDNGQRPDVSLRAAQKASRTKTPIAVIKPASNARSSTASIKCVVGSLFFWRFMVIRGLPPGVRPIGHLFVCKWARSSAFIQVQRICRPVVSDDHGVLLLISGTSGFILRMGV
jgi:hypothetical protein